MTDIIWGKINFYITLWLQNILNLMTKISNVHKAHMYIFNFKRYDNIYVVQGS